MKRKKIMETTKDLVKFVLESWMGQEDEDIVKNYVILLGKALEADEAEFAPLETSPTEASIAKAPSYVEDFNQLVVICFENLSLLNLISFFKYRCRTFIRC